MLSRKSSPRLCVFVFFLMIYSLHSGSVKGPVKLNFGQAEQAGYKERVIPVFSDFLRKCFSTSRFFLSSYINLTNQTCRS